MKHITHWVGIFFPHFCFACHFSFITDELQSSCIKCGSNNTINHQNSLLKNKN